MLLKPTSKACAYAYACTLAPLITASPLQPRDSTLGLHFAPNQTSACASSTPQILLAIADMRALSSSAISALQSPTQNPAAYFFPSSLSSLATGVFNAILTASLSESQLPTDPSSNLNPIELYCEDIDNLCSASAPGNNNLADPSSSQQVYGYVPQTTNPAPGFGTAQIVVCPAMLTLPRNPAQCTGTPGQATLGWAFLRTFVMLRSVQPGYPRAEKGAIYDMAPRVQQSHGLVGQGASTQNADSFAELGTLAWDLGVGSSMECLGDWDFV